MLVEEIKKRVVTAMKEGKDFEKKLLRVALGEIQTVQERQTERLTEDKVQKILRKMIANIDEVLEIKRNRGDDVSDLEKEKEILDGLLPKLWDQNKIKEFLSNKVDEIKSANNDGQAIGVAMKALKSENSPVQGKDVSLVVKEIRG